MSKNNYSTSYDIDGNVLSLSDLSNQYGSYIIHGDGSVLGPNTPFSTSLPDGSFTSTTTQLGGNTTTEWGEVQWRPATVFNPLNPTSYNYVDPVFGKAIAEWEGGSIGGANGFDRYAIYGDPGAYVYGLTVGGGNYLDEYFTSRHDPAGGTYTFNHRITFTANETIGNISGSAGVWQAGNAFTVAYINGNTRYDFFLQFGLVDQTGVKPGYYLQFTDDLFGSVINIPDTVGGSTATSAVNYLPFDNSNAGSLHTVTINLNEGVLYLANVLKNSSWSSAVGGDAVLDMSKWSMLSEFIGPESGSPSNFDRPGNDSDSYTGTMYVQNPEIHYDPNSTFSSANTGEFVQRIEGVTLSTTVSNLSTMANQDISLKLAGSYTPSQTIVSNGYWDDIDLNGKIGNVYVANGSHILGNNGSLTLSGPGNVYINGAYSGLYITPSNSSVVNASLSGYGNIVNNGASVSITGVNAGLTVSGSGATTLVGSYNGLVDTLNSGSVIYASITGGVNITNNGGYAGLTGDSNANISIAVNSGYLSLVGNHSSLVDYGNGNSNIIGSYASFSGSVGGGQNINISADTVSLYDNGATYVALTGTGGSLTFNGTGGATIVGDWSNVNATFGVNQRFNSIVGNNSYLTINDGGNANIWNQLASNVGITQNGGYQNTTFGSGYTGDTISMNGNAMADINNFHTSNGLLLLSNLNGAGLNVNYANGNAYITENGSSASVVIHNTNHVSWISSSGSTDFSQLTGSQTVAILSQ